MGERERSEGRLDNEKMKEREEEEKEKELNVKGM